MTPEQQALLMDNINLFHKYCSQHNITDEDTKQDLLLRLCKAIPLFDPEKGAISTYIYRVLHNEMIHLWTTSQNKLENTAISLDTPLNDEEDGDTIADVYGSEDDTFEMIERKEAYNAILKEYKKHYPETWKTDLEVFKAIVSKKDKIEIAHEFGVRYYAISKTFKQVSKFFRDYANGKEHPLEIRTNENDAMFIKPSGKFAIKFDSDQYYELINWVKKGFIPRKSINYKYNSEELSKIATKDLGYRVYNSDIKRAFYACGYSVPRSNLNELLWRFSIAEGSKALVREKERQCV